MPHRSLRKTFVKSMLAVTGIIALAIPSLNDAQMPTPAPAFTHTSTSEWLNSKPLRLVDLKGKPVLIEFWTFECVNCLRSVAWVRSVQERYKNQGLVVVAVHTPELPQERSATNVKAAVAKLGIEYPVMLDADYSYWRAMDNKYWPAFYLIDAEGRIAARAIGEMHVGEPRAKQLEKQIEQAFAKTRTAD